MQVKVFKHPEYGNINVVEINNEPWFVGEEIVEILGYTNPTVAITKLVYKEDIKKSDIPNGMGGRQRVTLINIFGLCALANATFLAVNGIATAKANGIKSWVMREIASAYKR